MIRTRLAALLLAIVVLPVAAIAANTKIATVDMEKLFERYYKTVRADASLEQQKELYKQHFQAEAEKIEAIKAEREQHQRNALNIALNDAARQENRRQAEAKEQLYNSKRQELESFIREKDQELGQQYMRLRTDIVEEINAFLAEYAQRQGIGLIFDASGMSRNMVPVVIYRHPDLDITMPVLAELNRGYEDEVEKAQRRAQGSAK